MNGGEAITLACSLIGAVGVVIAALLAIRGNRDGAAIRSEVVNGHGDGPSLRDDVDELRKLITDGFTEVRRDIGGIRHEVRTEREERIEGDRRRP